MFSDSRFPFFPLIRAKTTNAENLKMRCHKQSWQILNERGATFEVFETVLKFDNFIQILSFRAKGTFR